MSEVVLQVVTLDAYILMTILKLPPVKAL